jgi:uncharacterized membrane protein YfcA
MDWTVYWFMLPACVLIASVAMFSGISGAALLTPLFPTPWNLVVWAVPGAIVGAQIGSRLQGRSGSPLIFRIKVTGKKP